MKIVVDPGHGGRDPGAVGPAGVQEKVIALAVALKLAQSLSSVVEVKLTRTGDEALGSDVNDDLGSRVKIANDWGADLFVSVHCNSAGDQKAKGFEVWAAPGATAADKLAQCILDEYAKAFPDLVSRGGKEANFYVLKRTQCPAVLVEMAFISNPAEEALLASENFQQRAAQAIAQGVLNYAGLQSPSAAPRIKVGDAVLDGIMVGDRVFGPVRVLAEAMGRKVTWDEKQKLVKIL